MRSNKLPLFTFAGKRVEGRRSHTQGRVDCATCHDVHQWDPDNPDSKEAKNLQAKAHSGNSFLRVSADGDSKLCTSCHEKESQVIGTDHDYRLSAVWMDDAKKQESHRAGVCAQCHQGHNNKTKIGLWAREPGKALEGKKELDLQSSFCRSCHVKDHDLTVKDVPNGIHPDNVLVWKMPKRKIPGIRVGSPIPVFAPDGKKADVGIISCPSCHDPHQWKGSHTGPGPGRATEGSSMTSFLRKTSIGEIVCADCHGLDALFRYQYFHSETNTKDHPLYIEKKNTMK